MTNTDGATATLEAGDRPTAQELVERAREMIPALRERAPKTEELRRLPDETLQDFVDAGFLRTAMPERWGGYGYDLEVVADISGEIGRGCGSTGWLSSFYPCHQFIVTWFGEEAQAEYYGTSGPDGARRRRADDGLLDGALAGDGACVRVHRRERARADAGLDRDR